MNEAKQRMSDYLPEELWIQVLIRLPVKFILRCTLVSRSWKSLIESPHFIAAQLRFKRQDGTQNSCFLVRDCIAPRKENYEFYHDDQGSLVKIGEISSPFSVIDVHFQIVGTCNGLLCLSDEDRRCNYNLILWNPSVRKSVCLPRPNIDSSSGNLKHTLGFGFDPVSNDYKVVRVVSMVNGGYSVEIFRLNTHMWENISNSTISDFVFLKPEQAYLDGVVYWIGKSDTKGKRIVSFDLSEERFGEMELPENLAWKSGYFSTVSVDIYMGSLAVVVSGASEYCIWVLKESWTKQVCFGFHRNFGWPFGFRENGDIQFMKAFGRWDSFNPTHQKSKFLEVRPFTSSYLLRSLYGTPFVESLVFFDKGPEFNDSATNNSVNMQQLLLVFSGESDPDDSRKSDSEQSSEIESEIESDTEDTIE